MSRRVGPSEQGRLQGANSSIMGIANMVGPGLFTQTFALAIGAGSAWHLPGAPFVLSAGLLAVAATAAWAVTRSK
jgi:DHA1 family tetracycline resistance protein-like MFS transporter